MVAAAVRHPRGGDRRTAGVRRAAREALARVRDGRDPAPDLGRGAAGLRRLTSPSDRPCGRPGAPVLGWPYGRDHHGDDHRHVAQRVRATGRRPDPDDPGSRPRRRPGPGRAGERARTMAVGRRAQQPRRVVDDHRQATRDRWLPACRRPAAQDRRAGSWPEGGGRDARSLLAGGLHRGRRPPPHLPVLPSAAVAGVAGGADPPPGRRAEHRRDRTWLPGRRVGDGPADLPGEEVAQRGPRGVRAARGRRSAPSGSTT